MTAENPIDFIPGSTNILLIAPHGVETKPLDDENTAELTKRIASLLDCDSIINEDYRKPEGLPGESKEKKQARNNGKFDAKKNVLDLNKIEQAEKHPNWIEQIKNAVAKEGRTYVFWIHGIEDTNIENQVASFDEYRECPEKLHALIGYGQGPDISKQGKNKPDAKNESLTIEKESAERIARLLTATGMNTKLTSNKANNYRARAFDNMNQWFVQNKADFPNVKSLQIEIRKGGFREIHNLDSTAQIIAGAISSFVNPVEGAYQHLRRIFKKHIQNAMLECGQYLIDTFYDGEYQLAQKERENKFKKDKSLSKLIQRIQQDASKKGDAPSRAWLYDAVNLAIDNHLYEQKILPSAYRRLGHSHKVNLTYFNYTPKKGEDEKKQIENTKKYLKTKKDLVEETVRLKHSVTKLRERIREEKQQLDGVDKAINIFNLPPIELLMKESPETLNDLQAQSRTKINYHSNTLKKARLAVRRIEKAINTQKPTPAQLRQAIKNNEWTVARNNVNYQTGCSNACLYCYGRFMPSFTQQEKEAEKQGEIIKWRVPKQRKDDVDKNYGLKDGRVGFPTSHDITPDNLDDYLTVLGKLLRAGNKIMIITKPRLECIKAICEAVTPFFKDEILFRFTIGVKSEELRKFWEPGAPTYEHRLECLKYAYDAGFQTSVSIEPLLEYDKAQKMVEEMLPYTTDAIWFGKMSQISEIKKLPKYKDPDGRLKDELEKVEAGHSDENIKALYEIYKDNPKIKWKLAFKDVLGIPLPSAPGMDI